MLLSASVDVTSSRIEDNARAGVGNFDAHVGLGTSALSCNAFDLDGEMFFGVPFSFADLGGNGCGCPEPAGACVARSSGLAPPNTLADPP